MFRQPKHKTNNHVISWKTVGNVLIFSLTKALGEAPNHIPKEKSR